MKKYNKFIITILIILFIIISICFIPIRASKLIPFIEEQIYQDIGVDTHIERIVLRFGPFLKLKTPIIHLMFEDGQKFAQLNNVKIYISWVSLLKKNPKIKTIEAKKVILKTSSSDKNLEILLNNLSKKEISDIPNLKIKEYNLSYLNSNNKNRYSFEGQNLFVEKLHNYNNFKLKTVGNFSINSTKFISYDIVLLPYINIEDCIKEFEFTELLDKVKDLDFHSDIITNLKLYTNKDLKVEASGYINIDNISVLDKTNKNPKSFAYLTLWGDKASILSNIYTSVTKKVYIEGMINNSDRPILDIKVKTDEISLNDLHKKLRFLTEFSYLKNIKSVDGNLIANFNFKGDLNKIKSNGYLRIDNASIDTNSLKIDKINSEVDFSNNIINIKNAIGFVNDSPITIKGLIDKNLDVEIFANKIDLKHVCPLSWGVNKGVLTLRTALTGTLDKISHKENLIVENFNSSNPKLDVSFDSITYNSDKNNVAVINNILCKTKETEQIKIPTLKLFVDSDKIKIPETNIFMQNSRIVGKSEILDYNSDSVNYKVNFDGFINSKDLTRFSNNSTRYPLKMDINGTKNSSLANLQVLFEKTDVFDEPSILNMITKFEKNNLKIEDFSFYSFAGNFSNDFKSNLKGARKIILTGFIENISNPILKNVRLFIPQQLNFHFFDNIVQIKGDVFVNGVFNKPEIVGQILLQNLFNKSTQLSLSNCTIDFNKNNIVVNAPIVKLLDSSFGINSLMSTDFTSIINIKNINIKSKYINTDTLLMYKDEPSFKNIPIKINDGKFYSEKILANIYDSPLYLSAFTSDFNLDDKTIHLNNISSELFNGKLTGNVEYNLKDEIFKTKLMVRGVSAEPIFNVISPQKDTINGVMDFDTDITGELTSKSSLNGNIRFMVNNGRMSTLGKLEHLLYAQNVVADNMLRTSLSVVTKAITLKDTGLFKYLRGDIDIENGLANIKMLQSQGPLMSLFIKGKYNPLNNLGDLIILGRLSDEIVSGLGAFGDFSLNKLLVMLTGEETKHNIVVEDFDKIPQLPMKNTKEFRSVIKGAIDKTSSVISFNWISYSQKSLKQKEIPMTNEKVPGFIEKLPY